MISLILNLIILMVCISEIKYRTMHVIKKAMGPEYEIETGLPNGKILTNNALTGIFANLLILSLCMPI